MQFRDEIRETDPEAVRDLVTATGFFTTDEIEIAVELTHEAVKKGDESGYLFLFLDRDRRLDGYACYGPIPGTDASFDLYWIAVHPDTQGQGLGKQLVSETENRIRTAGGGRVYIETSSRDLYNPTRQFYLACGYDQEAILKDFYRPGDSKVIFSKAI